MKYLASSFLITFLAQFSCVSSSVPFVRGLSKSNQNLVFGLSRGGGLFDNDKAKTVEVPKDPDAPKKFPAMTEDEVSEMLEHVPVFAVTDVNGAGVVLRPDNETNVFYFFMSEKQANATLNQLKESGTTKDLELRVSAFSLGKIYFTLLNSDSASSKNQDVMLKLPGDDKSAEEITKNVEYRLVPDTRDLLGARMLLTMTAEDSDNLKKKDGEIDPEAAKKALQKAFEESPKFNSTYNEIPVFTIAQMRMQKRPEEGDEGEPITMLPMYFSLQQLVGTWQQFTKSAPEQLKDVEPSINLLPLKELIDIMMQESETDWRSIVLIPSSTGEIAAVADTEPTLSTPNPEQTLAGMGGDTLGDL